VVEGDFECEDETSPVPQSITSPPVGSGSISYLSKSIAVSSAIVDEESTSEILLVLHDGETRVASRSFSGLGNGEPVEKYESSWGVYDGSLLVALGLASASTTSFEVGTFEFSTNPDIVPTSGLNELTSGGVIYDSNENGEIEKNEEESTITGGTVTITGIKPNWSVSIDLILKNGQSVVGQFDGDYYVLPR